jgi:hypothetical protein
MSCPISAGTLVSWLRLTNNRSSDASCLMINVDDTSLLV